MPVLRGSFRSFVSFAFSSPLRFQISSFRFFCFRVTRVFRGLPLLLFPLSCFSCISWSKFPLSFLLYPVVSLSFLPFVSFVVKNSVPSSSLPRGSLFPCAPCIPWLFSSLPGLSPETVYFLFLPFRTLRALCVLRANRLHFRVIRVNPPLPFFFHISWFSLPKSLFAISQGEACRECSKVVYDQTLAVSNGGIRPQKVSSQYNRR